MASGWCECLYLVITVALASLYSLVFKTGCMVVSRVLLRMSLLLCVWFPQCVCVPIGANLCIKSVFPYVCTCV